MTRPTALAPAFAVLGALGLLAPAPCAAQVGAWSVHGRGSGTGSAFGSNSACNQSVSASRRFEGVLTIFADGTYRKPGGRACRRGSVLPDEIGTWRPGRKPRSFVLQPTNLDELEAALGPAVAECSRVNVSVDVRRLNLRTTFRVSADGQSIRGTERDSVTGSFGTSGIRCGFRVSVSSPFRGTLGGPPGSPTGALLDLRGGLLGR